MQLTLLEKSAIVNNTTNVLTNTYGGRFILMIFAFLQILANNLTNFKTIKKFKIHQNPQDTLKKPLNYPHLHYFAKT